ncbi:sensor histidine kinase [Novosphingobium malaysiense]|uniref:histidine kinase n=1 Tax=Novosphingobium malaysiense TaxID=1348853 RepID=A0A0B1ZWI1_9SPHN|nr:ATP-binding protein [Novosphingobium malaysiense]KHK93538.1 hypothetical protein LK12_04625 [Novosphingobium malaysiense]
MRIEGATAENGKKTGFVEHRGAYRAPHPVDSIHVAQPARLSDLRDMLSAIASGFGLIESSANEAKRGAILDSMRRTTACAQDLAARLLVEQRARAKTRIDVGEILSRLAGKLRPHLPEDILLSVRVWQGLPFIVADPDEFEAAIKSLIRNAEEAIHRGGVITVDARPSRGQVLVAVADTGTGMEPQVLERAATSFFTTKPGKDVGLGLMQVKRFAAQLGGHLSIRSTPEKGSLFVLHLPGAQTAGTASASYA